MTAGTLVGLLAAGKTAADILAACPYLEPDDINAALAYAAWRAEEGPGRHVTMWWYRPPSCPSSATSGSP